MNVKRTKSEGFMLRLPDGMRDDLKTLAAKNGRSLNAEIVERLKKSLIFETNLSSDYAAIGISEHIDPSEKGRIVALLKDLRRHFDETLYHVTEAEYQEMRARHTETNKTDPSPSTFIAPENKEGAND